QPTSRTSFTMAYDSARGVIVLFGGIRSDSTIHYLADTWECNGTDWMQRTPGSSPPARAFSAMSYDSGRGGSVLFGGSYYDGTTHYYNDTWEWNGTDWTQRTPANSAPSRRYHALAYDSVRGVTVLFGGFGPGIGIAADTWEWNGTNWTQRNPANRPPVRE